MNQMGGVEHYMDDKLYEAAQIQGADIPTPIDHNELVSQLSPGDGSNILHVAARCGNTGFILAVLGQVNPSIHYKLLCMHNSRGETPMHLAAQFGLKDTVEALLVAHQVDDLPQIGNEKKPCWIKRDENGDTPLHRALRCGHEDVALLLLERDVHLLFLDNNVGESPMYLAAYNWCIGFLLRALDVDRDGQCCVSFSGPFGQTVFHPAAKLSGDIMLRLIERRNHLLKVQDNKGRTVLHYVVEGGKGSRESMVETLLKNDSSLAYIHDNDGWTPLHRATSMGFLEMTSTILDLSPQSVHIRDKYKGKTALHVAKMEAFFLAQCLKTRMKELISEVDNDGNTPLHLALMNGDIESANALLQVRGINWRLANKLGLSPMDLCKGDDNIPIKLKCLASAWRVEEFAVNMEIFSHKHVKDVDDVLNHFEWNNCLTYRSPNGDSILHIAAKDGRMKTIRKAQDSVSSHRLLLSGVNTKGETPLHLAAEYGHLKVVKAIMSTSRRRNKVDLDHMENGEANQHMDPWMVEANGGTPSHRALRNGHQNIALLLMRLGPKLVTSVNKEGESLLYLAAENDMYYVLVKILCEAEFSISGPDGQNALHAAARKAGVPFVRRLIKRRPDLMRMIDLSGKTPLHHAVEYGRLNVLVELLAENKASALVYDNEGFTPFLRAIALGFDHCAARILDRCPLCAELRDLSNNRNALHLAKLPQTRLEIIMMRGGANVWGKWMNETDGDGNTPLHSAIINNEKSKAVGLLEMRGINWRSRNKQQQMPEDLYDKNQIEVYRSFQRLKRGKQYSMEVHQSYRNSFFNIIKEELEWKTEKEVEQLLNSILVVTALLVTITFAALFTIPGGYDPHTGQANLLDKESIQVFVVTDVVALLTGISVLLRYGFAIIFVRFRPEKQRELVDDSIIMLFFSLVTTTVAFISGLYAVASAGATVYIIGTALLTFLVPFISRWSGDAFNERLYHKISKIWQAAFY